MPWQTDFDMAHRIPYFYFGAIARPDATRYLLVRGEWTPDWWYATRGKRNARTITLRRKGWRFLAGTWSIGFQFLLC